MGELLCLVLLATLLEHDADSKDKGYCQGVYCLLKVIFIKKWSVKV